MIELEHIASLPARLRSTAAMLLTLAVAWPADQVPAAGDGPGAPRPNVLVIFVDNLGNGDLGCFGSTRHRTPHIDRLAAEGTRFTSFYVSSGVCTPRTILRTAI